LGLSANTPNRAVLKHIYLNTPTKHNRNIIKLLNRLPVQEENAMERTVSRPVCLELRDEYENICLEEIFFEAKELGKGMKPQELRRGIRRKAIYDKFFHHDNNVDRFINSNGQIKQRYQKEIDKSLEQFIEDCIQYGVLEKTSQGRFRMVMTDDTVLNFEHGGIRIQCKLRGKTPVYRHRMNTSGRIDVKANGDPAIDGVTSQDPLAY
jgi:hypothetical protein